MTIKVKISSDRTLDIKNRRFGGIQGDIGSVDLDFDISDIEEQERIWRVEFKGCAGTFESTVPLTPSENHIVVTIPTSITDVGGTAQVYLIEEQITNGEVVKRVCSYPLRLYFYNKPNEKTDVSISEYGRNVTEMYLFVANKASEIEGIKAEIEEEAHSASLAYTQAVEAIEGKENEVVGGNAITVDRETAEGKTIIGVDNSQVIGRDEFNHSIKPAIYEDIDKKADEEYVESLPSMIVETRFNQPEGNPIQFETSSDGTSHLTLDVDYELSADSDNAVANYVLKENFENKQDKEDGKGLSTNDYTTAEKDKLASVENGANKTVVDNEMSEESENPVQNKVLKSILDEKADDVEVEKIRTFVVGDESTYRDGDTLYYDDENNITKIILAADDDGNPFSLTEMILKLTIPTTDIPSNSYLVNCNPYSLISIDENGFPNSASGYKLNNSSLYVVPTTKYYMNVISRFEENGYYYGINSDKVNNSDSSSNLRIWCNSFNKVDFTSAWGRIAKTKKINAVYCTIGTNVFQEGFTIVVLGRRTKNEN